MINLKIDDGVSSKSRIDVEELKRDWEQAQQDKRRKQASLICPLTTPDCFCRIEKCAWWCELENMCAMKLTATSAVRHMGQI